MKSATLQRGSWAVLLSLATLSAVPAYARAHHSEGWARDRFAAAERMREALNGRPTTERTRRDYQRVINNYRSIYLGAPNSTKADPSVVAVAETMVEMGRRFEDEEILNKAVGQYRFLRREYPGSKYRFDALFTIGEIYKDDLDDPAAARATFQDFLHRYPHNRLAGDARQAISDLDEANADAKATLAEKTAKKESPRKSEKSKKTVAADPQPGDAAGKDKNDKDKDEDTGTTSEAAPEPHSHHLPRITGIRHWSTPDYTRVAIDVENGVHFRSQRIADPDRIFFDLPDTRLASTLVGKSFDVDDGFLKKIRVAQFAPGRARVVLEVDDLSHYDAFLLPDPYRLIIDIHGKNARTKVAKSTGESPASPDEAAALGPAKNEEASEKPNAPTQGDTTEKSGNIDAANDQRPVKSVAARNVKNAPVKKVVVDGGEYSEPSSPTQTADLEPRDGLSDSLHTAAKKSVSSPQSRSRDDVDDSDAPAVAHSSPKPARRKSNSRTTASRKTNKSDDFDIREARPTASGDRSLIRALGLKIGRIVIDPGHGGHDTGTIGPNGLEEKDLVLEVGRRLGKLLETRLGAEVVYTRKDDTFIPLETRTAVANQARADLFVSIHANSSRDPAARGVETYYLNFTSSPEALEVAARENAVSEKSIYELQDLVKKIALKEKIEESREFAWDVQESLHSGLAVKSPAIRDRGVKKAPFIVLIGANMPSILAEISFVSNPADEHRLATSEYRQRIAESLYRGISKYVNGLSGVKVASKMDKAAGQ